MQMLGVKEPSFVAHFVLNFKVIAQLMFHCIFVSRIKKSRDQGVFLVKSYHLCSQTQRNDMKWWRDFIWETCYYGIACLIVDEESVLVQLVSELIRLNRAADPEVATVAAQCLSEMGPVNLNVVALRGE